MLQKKIDPAQIDFDEAERILCTRSFAYFVKRAWRHIIPDPLVWNWHMDAIAEHLQALATGGIPSNRLLINVPPGASKSTLVGIMYSAWLWGPGGQPWHRYIGAAHEQGLAVRDNRLTRELVQSEWYQSLWPLALKGDQNEKLYFENEARGFRQACAIASMTGRRGHCLDGDTMVETSIGPKRIKDIAVSASTCYVISYDIHTSKLVQRPVYAVARGSSTEIYRVRSASGRVVVCSGDHRFYTSRGYIEARLLSKGDSLVRLLPSPDCSHHSGNGKGGKTQVRQCLLQPDMLNGSHQRPIGKGRAELHDMRREDTQREKALLQGVSRSVVCQSGPVQKGPKGDGRLCALLKKHDVQAVKAKSLLQQELQKRSSLNCHDRSAEPYVEEWGGQKADAETDWFPLYVEGSAPDGVGSRPWEVRRLQVDRSATGAPCGHGQHKQPCPEFGDDVRNLPHEIARGRQAKAESDLVAVVEKLCGERDTYDIQVSGTHCFFANGILVHNSICLDDPLSPEKAHSEAARETALRVLTETIPTRLNDPARSAIVIVMQRLHERDPAGYVLSEGLGYEHLCIPMEYEPGRNAATCIGWTDPRTEAGELMFPDRFPAHVVERDKRALGAYAWAGQMQQRPSPAGGGIFKDEWWHFWAVLPKLQYRIIFADTAQKTKEASDYSVFQCWGYTATGQAVLIDQIRGKWEAPELMTHARAFWAKHRAIEGQGALRSMKVEDKVSGTGLIQTLKREGIPVLPIQRAIDKLTRAMDAAPYIEAGNVLLPKDAAWLSDFMAECSAFPNGAHDDQIDPMCDAVAEVVSPAPTGWILTRANK